MNNSINMRLILLVSALIAIAFARNPRFEAIEIEAVQIVYEDDGAAACDTDLLRTCGTQYVQGLGVKSDGGPERYSRRIMALEAVYGRDGFQKICKAGQTFRKCVGRTFDQCMTVNALAAVGVPLVQAMSYVEIFKKKDYECSNMPSITAKGTWECLGMTALDQGVEQLQRCYTEFIYRASQTPGDVCKFAQQYELCIQRTFEAPCGAKVGRSICEISKVSFDLRLPQCKIECSTEEPAHFPNRPHVVGRDFATERHLINTLTSNEEIDDEQECDANRLKRCAVNARNSLGIRTSNIEQIMMQAGEIAKTKEGYLRVCRAEKQFTECAGPTVLPQCLSMESLMKLGLSITNAAEVNISYFIMDFECNQEVFADNYDCIVRVQREKTEELRVCQQQFSQIISQHPTHEVLCKAIQMLATCNQDVYKDACGVEVGEGICKLSGLMIKNFVSEAQTCSIQCTAQRSSMMHRVLPHHIIEQSVQISDDYEDEEEAENDCDLTKFRDCARSFKKELGIHGMGVRPLLAGLKTIIDKEGKKGFERICSAGDKFAKCGGGGDCLAIETLVKKLNMTIEDAALLNITAFSLTYECSHPVFHENFDCLVKTQKAKEHVLKRCEKRFAKEIKEHPGIPCKASQQLIDCTVSPFKRACGKTAAEGLCEFEKTTIETYLPHAKGCPLHCDI